MPGLGQGIRGSQVLWLDPWLHWCLSWESWTQTVGRRSGRTSVAVSAERPNPACWPSPASCSTSGDMNLAMVT